MFPRKPRPLPSPLSRLTRSWPQPSTRDQRIASMNGSREQKKRLRKSRVVVQAMKTVRSTYQRTSTWQELKGRHSLAGPIARTPQHTQRKRRPCATCHADESDSDDDDLPPLVRHRMAHWSSNLDSDTDSEGSDVEGTENIPGPFGRPLKRWVGSKDPRNRVASNSAGRSEGSGSGQPECVQKGILERHSSSLRSGITRVQYPPSIPAENRVPSGNQDGCKTEKVTGTTSKVPTDPSAIISSSASTGAEPSIGRMSLAPSTEKEDQSDDSSEQSESQSLASTSKGSLSTMGQDLRASRRLGSERLEACAEGDIVDTIWTDADFEGVYSQLVRCFGVETDVPKNEARVNTDSVLSAGEHTENTQDADA